MQHIRDPHVDMHKYPQLSFDKSTKFNRGRIDFSTMVLEKSDIDKERKKESSSKPHTLYKNYPYGAKI